MATSKETIDFILDQLGNGATARKMFGEYALYYNGTVVALVCDNTLFVKPTPEGIIVAEGHYTDGYAYPGAKVSLRIDEDSMENREWLCELIQTTAAHLPPPQQKKPRRQPL